LSFEVKANPELANTVEDIHIKLNMSVGNLTAMNCAAVISNRSTSSRLLTRRKVIFNASNKLFDN